jgi:hypothetical protein
LLQLQSLQRSMESRTLSQFAQLSKILRGLKINKISSKRVQKLKLVLCQLTQIWLSWDQILLSDQSLTLFTILLNVLLLVKLHIRTLLMLNQPFNTLQFILLILLLPLNLPFKVVTKDGSLSMDLKKWL